MVAHFEQDFFGTISVLDEKPVIAQLVVDGKLMPAIFEIEPHLNYAVRDKLSDFRAIEFFRMVGNFVKKDGFGHIGKMP